MFISWQTYEGFQISVFSVIETTKFLLQEGMEFVLTERFCQDPAEEYFGNQRKLGRGSDNPDISSFGYNNNTIRIQRAVSCQSGNTRGRHTEAKHGSTLQTFLYNVGRNLDQVNLPLKPVPFL